jgi:hypothetical protein
LPGVSQPEQPERSLLLEVQSPRYRPGTSPGPPAEFGYLGSCSRIRQDPQAEGKGRGADVIAPLDRQRQPDGVQVAVGELAVRGMLAGACGRAAQQRKQAERLPVPEHPGRGTEALSRFRDAHAANLTNSCQERR